MRALSTGRLAARVRADDQQRVGALDAGDGGVEQIGRPAPVRIERRAVLAGIEVLAAEPRHQVLQREHLLDRGEVAGDGADPVGLAAFTLAAIAANACGQDAGCSRPFSRT